MRSRWRWVIPVVAVLSVSLGACGGGGGKASDPVGTEGAGATADNATARTIVLQQADMPAGWVGAVHNEDPVETARNVEINLCLGRPDPTTYRTAIVYGPDFTMGMNQVSTSATVLDTVADAKADLDAVQGPKYANCIATAFREDVVHQSPVAQVGQVMTEALPTQNFGDGSVGLRLSVDLVYSDHTDHLFADLIYISKNRATVSATFFSFNQPFTSSVEDSLVARMGNRVAAA